MLRGTGACDVIARHDSNWPPVGIRKSRSDDRTDSGRELRDTGVAVHSTEDVPVELLGCHGMEWNRSDRSPFTVG